jgi:hypothetical protein
MKTALDGAAKVFTSKCIDFVFWEKNIFCR